MAYTKRTTLRSKHSWKGRGHQSKGGPKGKGQLYSEAGNGGQTSKLSDSDRSLFVGGAISRGNRRYDGKTETA